MIKNFHFKYIILFGLSYIPVTLPSENTSQSCLPPNTDAFSMHYYPEGTDYRVEDYFHREIYPYQLNPFTTIYCPDKKMYYCFGRKRYFTSKEKKYRRTSENWFFEKNYKKVINATKQLIAMLQQKAPNLELIINTHNAIEKLDLELNDYIAKHYIPRYTRHVLPLLYYAVRYNPSLIEPLIQKGHSPNEISSNRISSEVHESLQLTPLHYAVIHNPTVIPLLIEYGADPKLAVNGVDENKFNLLHFAIMYSPNPLTTIDMLLKNNYCDINILHGTTFPVLHCVLLYNPALVSDLLRLGADPNSTDLSNKTFALEIALRHCPNAVPLLLSAGADPHIKYKYNRSSLHIAASHCPEWIPELIKTHGIDPNILTRDGNTPLHYAKSPEAVSTLVALGADVNKPNTDGQLPVRNAESLPLLKAFIEAGACLEQPTRTSYGRVIATGNGMLHDLAGKKSDEHTTGMIEALEGLVDPNATNHKGETPLYIATMNEPRNIPPIIKIGGNINSKCCASHSPLYHSVKELYNRTIYQKFNCDEKVERIRILLENGADPCAIDYEESALSHALSTNCVPLEIIIMLIRRASPEQLNQLYKYRFFQKSLLSIAVNQEKKCLCSWGRPYSSCTSRYKKHAEKDESIILELISSGAQWHEEYDGPKPKSVQQLERINDYMNTITNNLYALQVLLDYAQEETPTLPTDTDDDDNKIKKKFKQQRDEDKRNFHDLIESIKDNPGILSCMQKPILSQQADGTITRNPPSLQRLAIATAIQKRIRERSL